MNKNEWIDTICIKTGISKRNLAKWIDTHHTNLTKYQAGTRSLPVAAVQQLAAMHTVLNNLPGAAAAQPSEIERADMKQQASLCREKLRVLQKNYDAMLVAWQTATVALQMTNDIVQQDAILLTEKKQRWIEEQRYQATKQLAANGPAAQQKLTIQIALLQKEAELYEVAAGIVE